MFSVIEQDYSDAVIKITVKDSGIGMSKEAVERAFEPFSRVDGQRGSNTASNGVGLSICKSICQQLGGDIEVASTLGQGTTFKFSIPAKQ